MRSPNGWLLVSMLAAVACGLTARAAMAQQGSTTERLPGRANALMIVEVAKLLESPLAQQLGWQSKLIKGYSDRPLAVPANAKRVTIAAAVHPAGMRAVWQAAIIELPNPPRLDPILRAQGGYLDLIGGKKAAWTPRDVFFVELDQTTLGVVRPGQRQYVTRWVTGKDQTGLSPYLKTAQAGGGADVLFALDLDDVVGVTAIRYALHMGQLPSLEKLQDDPEKLASALASVKGIKLSMQVRDRIVGELVVDFEQDISSLANLAKPFVIDVLTIADLYEPNVDQWEFKTEGKKIVGQGTMELDALNRMVMLLSPATVNNAAAAADAAVADSAAPSPGAAGAPQPTAAVTGTEVAQASQRYYRAVASILDTLRTKTSPTESATWLVSKARVIEQLPVLNVDPALLEWGNMVSGTLNRAAVELGIGQQKAIVAAQGVASPTASVSYGGGGWSTSDTPEGRAAYRNAQQQRRQVSQAERAAAGERALAIINESLPARGKIRIEMTQKYGVEF